ncbi:PAS domain S-box protein [Magnetospirillum aberrantis]|uniref:histidine kinase n=1 Tax=Magnetospirillum aberrantis SpK TaxID=908842 RepID=A0A7C9QSU9_9PROT|nr:PAS domain S-box protein [Magnetospirillum aberrantis SpK]
MPAPDPASSGKPAQSRSFAYRLTALVVMANMFAVVLATLALVNSWKHQHHTADTVSQNLTHLLESSLAATFDRIDDGLLTVAEEIKSQERRGYRDDGAVLELMDRQSRRTDEVIGLRVTDAKGTVVHAVGEGAEHDLHVGDRDYFRRLSQSDDDVLVISSPVLGRATEQWVIVAARRISHHDGSFAGVAYAPISLDKLSRNFEQLDLGSRGAVALRDASLAVVVRYPETLDNGTATIRSASRSNELAELVKRQPQAGTYFATTPIDSVTRTVSYRKIGDHPLYILVGLATQDYLREWWSELVRTVALIMLFCALSTWGARHILRSWHDEEKALEQASDASARLEAVFANTPIGLALVDHKRHIIDANESLAAIFRVPPASLKGQSTRVLYGDDSVYTALGNHAYPEITAGGTFEDTVFTHRADGTPLWLKLTGRLIHPGKTGRGYIWIFEDITQQVTTTEALRASEERFRVLVDGIRDYAVMLLDPEGRVQTWNQGAKLIKGYEAEDVIGQSTELFHPPEDVTNGVVRTMLETARSHGHAEIEGWHVRKNGSRFWAHQVLTALHDESGGVRGFAKIVHDITVQRQAAEQIHRLASYQQAILANTPVGIAILGLDRIIVQANEAFCRIYGRDGENLAGLSASILYGDPAQSEDVRQRAYPMVVNGGTFTDDVLMCRRDGTQVWVHLVAHLVDETTPELGVVWAAQDVSTMKELNENLLRSNAELERFAYVASHDLRQPLRMISSYMGLIERRLRKTGLDEEMAEFLGYAIDGAQRMDRMIIDMLEYSRIGRQSSPREDVALEEPLRRALSNLGEAITEAQARITVEEPLPTINASASELERLFQNLIGNAVKFCAPDRAPCVNISCRETPMEWIISVADNGIGVDPSQYDRLFALFSRLVTPKQYQGTGIGLAACRKIAEHHGGRIWVEPAPQQGTVFHVSLARPRN